MLITEHRPTIEACRFCFMCRHVCTVGVISGKESDTPRGKGLILFKILKGHADYTPDLIDTLYRCCLCGLCETWCKADCHPPAAVLAARSDVVAQGKEPGPVRQIKDHLLQTGNPFGLPAEERFQAFAAPNLFRPQAEVVYYVGCDTAYRQPPIARALSEDPRRSANRLHTPAQRTLDRQTAVAARLSGRGAGDGRTTRSGDPGRAAQGAGDDLPQCLRRVQDRLSRAGTGPFWNRSAARHAIRRSSDRARGSSSRVSRPPPSPRFWTARTWGGRMPSMTNRVGSSAGFPA